MKEGLEFARLFSTSFASGGGVIVWVSVERGGLESLVPFSRPGERYCNEGGEVERWLEQMQFARLLSRPLLWLTGSSHVELMSPAMREA